jgi:hypothetical protein
VTEVVMQDVELRAVALGKKLRSVALEYGFGLNEAGLIVHEALLNILRDLPEMRDHIPSSLSPALERVGQFDHPAPSAWRGR